MKYLIIKYDVDDDTSTPICVTDDYSKYNKMGYEIYEIKENGSLVCVREYDEVTCKEMVVCVYDNAEEVDIGSIPSRIHIICNGNRDIVTKNLIKTIKQKYRFTEPIDNIMREIKGSGSHGELIKNQWVVFGEKYDSRYPYGF